MTVEAKSGMKKKITRKSNAAISAWLISTPSTEKTPATEPSVTPSPAGTMLTVEGKNSTANPTNKSPKVKSTPAARKQKKRVEAVKNQSMLTQKKTRISLPH